jgi:hypothetical protein
MVESILADGLDLVNPKERDRGGNAGRTAVTGAST